MTSIPRFKSRYALCFSAARSVVHLQHRRRGDVAARLGLRTRRGLRRRLDFTASWAVPGLVLRRCFPQAPPLGSRAEGGGLDGEIAQRQRTSILCHAGFVVTPAQIVPSPVCLSAKVLSLRTALARSNTGVADKQEGQVGIKWWLRWRRSTCPRPLAPSGIKDPRLIRRPRRCLRAVRMGASLMSVISDSLCYGCCIAIKELLLYAFVNCNCTTDLFIVKKTGCYSFFSPAIDVLQPSLLSHPRPLRI